MNNEYIRKLNKNKKKKDKQYEFKSLRIFFSKFLITIVLTIMTLIVLKANPKLKTGFHQKVYEENFSFAKINTLYEKYFGSTLPFKDLFSFLDKNEQVFNETLTYKESSEYL